MKMWNKGIPNKKILVVILFLLFTSLALGLWFKRSWIRKQESIHITPEEVVKAFQEEGYRISNVRLSDERPGPMALPKYGIRFDLSSGTQKYDVYVTWHENWEVAQLSTRGINALDKRMNGGYAYAFSYGDILVQVAPSTKDMGRELFAILKKID
ncbi:MAG: hypothetical protein U9O54_06940 [Chloroflexota bacterium]|nr:hypothetical protein [Chloroflexota bacterium]